MGRLIPMAPKPVPPTLPAATGAFLDQRDHPPSTRRVYTSLAGRARRRVRHRHQGR